MSAALHKLAANVELATPDRERWIVQPESFHDARGRVYLELADATHAEAERGASRSCWAEGQTSSPQPRRCGEAEGCSTRRTRGCPRLKILAGASELRNRATGVRIRGWRLRCRA